MIHWNKRNSVWDRIFQHMKDGATYLPYDREAAAFCFGVAAAIAIETAGCMSMPELERMSWLRTQLRLSARK
jgi:hypothetical protein